MKKIVMLTIASLLSACSMLPQKSVSGTYQGVLPCADCTKIEAELILNSDQTYQYSTVYYKKKEKYPFVEKGTYIWDNEKPNVIRLTNSNNLAFYVSENDVEVCDARGNKSTRSNKYKLSKLAQ